MFTTQTSFSTKFWKYDASGSIALRGTTIDKNNNTLSPASLYTLFQNVDPDQTQSILSSFNGFYSLSVKTDRYFIAAVDHIRSSAIFYSLTSSCLLISDSAEWIRKKLQLKQFDIDSLTDFHTCGFVTGNNTLFTDIKQLQAGEFLYLDTGSDTPKLLVKNHFILYFQPSSEFPVKHFSDRLRNCIESTVNRLTSYANGRQLVLPLSGGYDSRLLAMLLAESNYANILTFSYGLANDKEVEVGGQVANQLGLAWTRIDYTPADWKAAWDSEQRECYENFSSGWSTLPHFQDWLAVKKLKNYGLLEPNCIFVPGHTGDFIAGGHIPENKPNNESWNLNRLTGHILDKHGDLVHTRYKPETTFNRIYEQLEYYCELNSIDSNSRCGLTDIDLAYLYQRWEWNERQAKYIVNSVRVYEYYGYDWWLPFWDKSFVNFWTVISLHLLYKRNAYISFVKHQYSRQTMQDSPLGNANEGIWVRNKTLNNIKTKFSNNNIRRAYVLRSYIRRIMFLVRIPDSRATFTMINNSMSDRWRLFTTVTPLGLVAEKYTKNSVDSLSQHAK